MRTGADFHNQVMAFVDFDFVEPVTPEALGEVRELFVEYAATLGFSLCFQGFDQELAGLPGAYAPPSGRIVLAKSDGKGAGVVGLRDLGGEISEMKRLYVRPEFRGTGLGRALARRIVDHARTIGYERMRLDTLSTMTEAIALYRSLGFVEIPPYRENPIAGALFFELVIGK